MVDREMELSESQIVESYKEEFNQITTKGILQILRDSCEAIIEKEKHDDPELDIFIKHKLIGHIEASLLILRRRWK